MASKRVRWRGFELPGRMTQNPNLKSPNFGQFVIEPFERGFGTTVGNSLRRVLLSSIEGAAVSSIKIAGAEHEFSSLPGVLEDVADIILNIKDLVVQLEGDASRTMILEAEGPGVVTADLIEADANVTIVNKDLVIATLTEAVDLEIAFTVTRGRGYVPASEHYKTGEDQEIGIIPVDASYSPVRRVRYKVENTRVGQKTNYDKLIMDIWTNGTVTPEMSLVEAAKILRKHLNPFVMYQEIGEERVSEEASVAAGVDEELLRKLRMPIGDLDLSVRASNCLDSARIRTVAELITKSDSDLLKVRSFGKTSLREVKKKLEEINLALGMELPEGFDLEVMDIV
ncbi:MAG: DNA-directed RNA polymerase subunit alpha [Planctomycetes bacterium]|nr:DNA-directed RNA polymerase subunit alpha [Planctomycetota bacterium]NOG55507.1 DNA-directed RNA polymerase subunit alpha [Planctomycetota bacterium]